MLYLNSDSAPSFSSSMTSYLATYCWVCPKKSPTFYSLSVLSEVLPWSLLTYESRRFSSTCIYCILICICYIYFKICVWVPIMTMLWERRSCPGRMLLREFRCDSVMSKFSKAGSNCESLDIWLKRSSSDWSSLEAFPVSPRMLFLLFCDESVYVDRRCGKPRALWF